MIASTLVSGSDRARGQARLVGRILIGVFGAAILASMVIVILAELAR